eukprot:CAMPEP_0181190836 /NCGR_PEP_ID=MMETSP1096-20121128/12404_1 /TAXON_ID=156174 ORGANISM="Chrysochromulina ericina, Strain CCMP281" /NCGR_SAMPLE_ID=MMETSP1096 /ASSEMBLY_ACC=CAM_ASM_000453 /LENGTH=67 /DNA_ID=CAMNT_0023280075 /DNA_START=364 /DNA_END=567 /DNA_ORIENTATION=-
MCDEPPIAILSRLLAGRGDAAAVLRVTTVLNEAIFTRWPRIARGYVHRAARVIKACRDGLGASKASR